MRFICKYVGIFISPEKPGLFLRFVKEYWNGSGEMVTAFEERKTNAFYVQQNLYTTTINRVLPQMEQTTKWKSLQKRVQGRVQDVKYG